MTEKEFDKTRKDIAAASFRQKRKCIITDCNQTAIQSHLVQRKGILNHLINNGHLYEVAFLQYPQAHYNFKKVGWKDALTFPGFCAQHDSKIFQPIEKGCIDFTDYQSLLLLLYRPLVHEYRQKEIVTEGLMKALSDKRFQNVPLDIEGINNVIVGETLSMWDIEFFTLSLQEDLLNNSESYKFSMITLPKIDICVSSVISYRSLAESFLTDPMDLEKKEPISSMLFNLIPTANDTRLILGYHYLSEKHVKPKIDYFYSLNQSQLLKEVSDTLIRNCGTWSCSEFFYFKQIKPQIKSVLSLMNYFVQRNQFSKQNIELNLFDSIS